MKSKKLFFYQTVFFASLFLITPATAMDGIAIQPIKCIHNESLLRKAAQNNNPEELIRIINIGVNINHQDVLTGNTAMHYATINNYEVKKVSMLILKIFLAVLHYIGQCTRIFLI